MGDNPMNYVAARKWLIGSILAAIISLSFKCISLHFANEAMIGMAMATSLANQASERVDRSDSLQRQAQLDAQRSDLWGAFGLSSFVAAIVLFVPSLRKKETRQREVPIVLLIAIGMFQILYTV